MPCDRRQQPLLGFEQQTPGAELCLESPLQELRVPGPSLRATRKLIARGMGRGRTGGHSRPWRRWLLLAAFLSCILASGVQAGAQDDKEERSFSYDDLPKPRSVSMQTVRGDGTVEDVDANVRLDVLSTSGAPPRLPALTFV